MENKEQTGVGNNEEFQENNGASEGGQVQEGVKAEDYKSLQSEFTKTKQAQIDLAVRLANADKKSILTLDKKIQDKVVKEIYGLDNLEEVKLIHGEKFYEDKNNEENDLDELTRIKRELELVKFNQSKSLLEGAIDVFKKENKDFFNNEDAERKLREEIKYISSDLSPNERITRAFRIAFGINPNDAGYLALKEKQTQGGNASYGEGENKNKSTTEEEIKAIFRGNKK